MVNYLSLNDAVDYGLKYAKKIGAEQIEVFSSYSREIDLSIEKKLPKLANGIQTGISFRVATKNNQGFGFTKTLTKERIETTIKTALQNAKSRGKDPDFKTLPFPSKKPVVEIPFDKKITSLTSDMLADETTTLIDTINGAKNVHFLQSQLFLVTQENHLVNSNGIDIKYKGGALGGVGVAISTKGLIPNMAYVAQGSNLMSLFSIQKLAEETVSQVQRAAGPKTLNFEKEVPLILEPEASTGIMGGLFMLLMMQLQGNNVATGSTPYSDQVGNEVATDSFTLIDNGLNANKITSSSHDGEGMPREKTVLIDRGILKTYLLDTYYGNKLGLESNGKSSRSGMMGMGDPIKNAPAIGTTSVEILGGDSSKDEMISETKEGFMIRSLMGLHMSDQSSGRFSVTGFGWYIKNGEVKYPVQGLSISGMLPDLIKNIDMISEERESMLLSDAPYIRFANVPVTSKKFDLKIRLMLGVTKAISLITGKHPAF